MDRFAALFGFWIFSFSMFIGSSNPDWNNNINYFSRSMQKIFLKRKLSRSAYVFGNRKSSSYSLVRMLHIYFCWCVKRWPVDISPGVEELVSARLVTRWPTAPHLTPAPAEIIKIRTKIRARPQQPVVSTVSVVTSSSQLWWRGGTMEPPPECQPSQINCIHGPS